MIDHSSTSPFVSILFVSKHFCKCVETITFVIESVCSDTKYLNSSVTLKMLRVKISYVYLILKKDTFWKQSDGNGIKLHIKNTLRIHKLEICLI